MIDNLMKLLNVKEEVLLIRHLLPVPLFPSKGSAKKITLCKSSTNHASDQLRPFIAIHWRMEITKPKMPMN